MSDDGGSRVGREFPLHQSINHSIGEYVRGEAADSLISFEKFWMHAGDGIFMGGDDAVVAPG